jgi:hypothetical protein
MSGGQPCEWRAVKYRALALYVLLPTHFGCTVTAVSQGDDPRPNNSCDSDSDCGADSCRDGLCQTLNGQLEALLISASPPSDSSIPHLTFVTQLDDVPTSGGSQDLTLPGPSVVVGSLVLPKGLDCYPGFRDDFGNSIGPADDGKTLPVTVTLALRQRLLGLPQQLYFASSDTTTRNYTFDVQVPRGEYDVYLVPPSHQEGGCRVPPQLYRSFSIDRENWEIILPLSSISQLPLVIRWPKSSPSLTGWSVDIIEPLGGNPISTNLVLGDPIDLGANFKTVDYSAPLSFSSVIAPSAAAPAAAEEVTDANDLLRLRPPANLVAPTIFLDRSRLGLLLARDEHVVLDRFTRIPEPVRVVGQLARLDGGAPVSGYVTLISTEIYGVDSGIFASYQTTFQVGVDGALDAQLPPGKYRVQAVPPMPGAPDAEGFLAALDTIWDIPADPPVQYGKLLELRGISAVVGQTPFLSAQVQAVPSPQTILPFDQVFGAGTFTPRASNGLVDDAGQFVVQADPGSFDVSVQAPESLGFGWYVHPGVQVGDRNRDLGGVSLPRPSLLSGTARVALGGTEVALNSAAIRAYAYLDKDQAYTRDATQAVSVVQVAETRADENGAFRLLVPSRITASK